MLLALFFIWLLSFVLNDIGDLPGRIIPPSKNVTSRGQAGGGQRVEVPVRRDRKTDQATAGNSGHTKTKHEQCRDRFTKIADLQRLSLEGGGEPSEVDRQAMENARTRFYDAQDKFESANETITTLNSERHQLNQSIEANGKELSEFENKASTEYNAAFRLHQLKIAVPAAVVVPLLFLRLVGATQARQHVSAVSLGGTVLDVGMTWLVMRDHFRDFFASPSSRS